MKVLKGFFQRHPKVGIWLAFCATWALMSVFRNLDPETHALRLPDPHFLQDFMPMVVSVAAALAVMPLNQKSTLRMGLRFLACFCLPAIPVLALWSDLKMLHPGATWAASSLELDIYGRLASLLCVVAFRRWITQPAEARQQEAALPSRHAENVEVSPSVQDVAMVAEATQFVSHPLPNGEETRASLLLGLNRRK